MLSIIDADPEEYGRVLAHNALYNLLYGCNTLDSRLDIIDEASRDNSSQVVQWLTAVRSCASEIEAKACDFSDDGQLERDERELSETENFLLHQSDLLPYQMYSVRDLALKSRHAGKL